MKTHILTALPFLLLGCRTPIDASLDVDTETIDVDTDSALIPIEEVRCAQEVQLTEAWSAEWAPYGIWNGLFSFSPDGETLLLSAGIYDRRTLQVDAKTGQTKAVDSGSTILHRDESWHVDLRASFQLTDVATGDVLFSLDERKDGQDDLWSMDYDVRLSKNGVWATAFGSRGGENTLSLWHVPTKRFVGEMRTGLDHQSPYWDGRIHNSELSDEGILFFVHHEAGTLHRADVWNGEILSVDVEDDFITTVVLSQDGRTLFSAGTNGEILRYNATDLSPVDAPLQSSSNLLNSGIYAPQYFASPIAQSPDGQLWASLDWDGSVVLRDRCSDFILDGIATPDTAKDLYWGNTMGAYALAFDATGQRLAVAREGMLEIWHIDILD
jgi:WD40 repeat protein